MVFYPDQTPTLISSVALLGLGLWVLVLRPNDRLHRGLFLFTWCRSWGMGPTPFGENLQSWPYRITVYFLAGAPVAAAWFAYETLVATGQMRRRAWVPWALLAAYVLVAADYIRRPDAYLGPPDFLITVFASLQQASMSALALMFAVMAMRQPPSTHRKSLRYMAVGFATGPAYFAVRYASFQAPPDASFLAWSIVLLDNGSLFALLATAAVLAIPLRAAGQAALIIAAGLSWTIEGAAPQLGLPPIWTSTMYYLPAAAWTVAGVCCIAYGLLHHRLFSVQLVGQRVARIAVTLVAAGLSAAGSLLLTADAATPLRAAWALGTAAVLAWPLHWLTGRALRMWSAQVVDDEAYRERRRAHIYGSAVAEATATGHMDEAAGNALVQLQRRLQITTPDARRIERRVLDGATLPELQGKRPPGVGLS